jgi:hypothetical protein
MTLGNTRFVKRPIGEPPVERMIGNFEELKSVLGGEFGISLPEGLEVIREKLGL